MLSPEFIDQFAIVSSPQRCIDRLHELADLGLDKVVLNLSWGTDDAGRQSRAIVEREVLPALRA